MPSALDFQTARSYASYNGKSTGSVSIPRGGVAGEASANVAQTQQEMSKFQSLIDGIQAGIAESDQKKATSTLSSSQIAESGRLNGDYTTSLKDAFQSPADKSALPSGAAANAAGAHGISSNESVDKTSKLYQQALELESYFVKIMLSSMRSTITKTNLSGENNAYAQNMYEDMLYDELATSMTKSAGFGLADQIYIQLNGAS